ncbi:MAG: hypothetical protein A2066_13020 [Bacteroidetes bacterium GWB2_41_8]|nr:MAG: hypothetical protein A2066_13020 [Bacteroidetes bacterium GWB2_41_8]
MRPKKAKMSFTDYYTNLKNIQAELRDKICQKLEISEKTFYNKLNNDTFDYPQKVVIAQILESSVEVLFPQKQTA